MWPQGIHWRLRKSVIPLVFPLVHSESHPTPIPRLPPADRCCALVSRRVVGKRLARSFLTQILGLTIGLQSGGPSHPALLIAQDAPFLPSATFQGGQPGYVFQRGPQGVGYYLDPAQGQVWAVKYLFCCLFVCLDAWGCWKKRIPSVEVKVFAPGHW